MNNEQPPNFTWVFFLLVIEVVFKKIDQPIKLKK